MIVAAFEKIGSDTPTDPTDRLADCGAVPDGELARRPTCWFMPGECLRDQPVRLEFSGFARFDNPERCEFAREVHPEHETVGIDQAVMWPETRWSDIANRFAHIVADVRRRIVDNRTQCERPSVRTDRVQVGDDVRRLDFVILIEDHEMVLVDEVRQSCDDATTKVPSPAR